MPFVSILVPVYNVEAYIGQCLDSLVNQTYFNMEIICINDGSTDRSLEIIEAYQKKYPQIHVYSYANAGVSTTRNRALALAQGDMIMFVDSDDFIALDTVEKMVYKMEKDACDLVTCGYSFEIGRFKVNRRVCKNGNMTNIEALHSLAEGTGINNYPWGKLFKRSCFDGVRFPENQYAFEDAYTIFKAIIQAKKIGNLSQRMYHYQYRKGSLTNEMDLATIYRMRKSIVYQEGYLRHQFPMEKFNFSVQYYNADMMILYTLVKSYHRSDRVIFEPSDIDWKTINPILRIGYVILSCVANWKVGCMRRVQEDFKS